MRSCQRRESMVRHEFFSLDARSVFGAMVRFMSWSSACLLQEVRQILEKGFRAFASGGVGGSANASYSPPWTRMTMRAKGGGGHAARADGSRHHGCIRRHPVASPLPTRRSQGAWRAEVDRMRPCADWDGSGAPHKQASVVACPRSGPPKATAGGRRPGVGEPHPMGNRASLREEAARSGGAWNALTRRARRSLGREACRGARGRVCKNGPPRVLDFPRFASVLVGTRTCHEVPKAFGTKSGVSPG